MKKIIAFCILCFILIIPNRAFAFQGYTYADADIPIDLIINGSFISSDVPPFISYDTTYVPIRVISNVLGADSVTWEHGTATIKKGAVTIQLTENQNVGYVNGNKVALRGSVKLVNGRCFVPVRFIAESFGASVGWDPVYYNVHIDKAGITVAQAYRKTLYSNDEVFWLGRIIEAESSGEPNKGKVAVGNVILNRVKSKEFPNTIYGVIFDRKNGVQFEPIINNTIYNTPSNASIISAKHALNNTNFVGNSLFFLNPRTASSSWITNNRVFYTTIANHDFYL